LTLYDIANIDGCTIVGAEPEPDWITLVISIRGITGEIYRITPVRKVDIDALKKVDLVGEDEILVLTCYDGKNTIAEMYCLREEDAKKWQPEVVKYQLNNFTFCLLHFIVKTVLATWKLRNAFYGLHPKSSESQAEEEKTGCICDGHVDGNAFYGLHPKSSESQAEEEKTGCICDGHVDGMEWW
ncbi:unnamed protein product, partial [Strongylus vulgaris]